MKSLKNFEEFLKNGIIKKQSKDSSRSKDLVENSKKLEISIQEIVKKIGINNSNSHLLIKESYDSIMELIRSLMFLNGFISTGRGAHEAEVSFLRRIKIDESDVLFLNQLRYIRNGLVYYGAEIDSDYAKKVLNFSKKITPLLKIKIKENLK